jgi:hypothetical protein
VLANPLNDSHRSYGDGNREKVIGKNASIKVDTILGKIFLVYKFVQNENGYFLCRFLESSN